LQTITVTRKTTESEMMVRLSPPPLAGDYRKKIDTPLIFLNHMIEHIAWRSGFNVEVSVKLDKFNLAHVICEDLGIALGRAVAEYIDRSIDEGVNSYGFGVGIIDEAKAECVMSFESRSYFGFTSKVALPAYAEDMHAEDLQVFLDGFAQGARATVHLDIEKGENSHHIWEAAYRAFGIALGEALRLDPEKKGRTSGVAGRVGFTVEVE
jgi:imidazoleglycerol-phosphate dehydratase